MLKNYFKNLIILIFGILVCTQKINAQTWPCGQYVTRQVSVAGNNTAPFKSVISILYTNTNGTVGLDPVCENTNYLFNGAVFYNGYIYAWRQYNGTQQNGTTKTICRINSDCTVTEYLTDIPVDASFNNAYVDGSGNYFVSNPNTVPNFNIYKLDLNTLSTTSTNPTSTIEISPNGDAYTNFSAGTGDIYFDGTNVYIWINGNSSAGFQGLAKIDYQTANTGTYTRISSADRVAGSLFINSGDPGYLYGYGSGAGGGLQNRILKIAIGSPAMEAIGTVIEVTPESIDPNDAVSQSDGAGCPNSTFELPKPVAKPESKCFRGGSSIFVTPNDLSFGNTTIDITRVSLVPPAGATVNTIDAQGDIVSVTVPLEGDWLVNLTSGEVTFQPLSGFFENPTKISYNVRDSSGKLSNDAEITSTGCVALGVDLISFDAINYENKIILNWKTANESNFSHYEVQKSTNSIEFSSITDIKSIGLNFYNFTDNEPNTNMNYYRLKMVDLDGTYKFSKIIAVNFSSDKEYFLLQNPVIGGVIDLNTSIKSPNFYLLNIIGQKLNISPIKIGNNRFMINISQIQNGIYFLSLVTENKVITKKIIIQN